MVGISPPHVPNGYLTELNLLRKGRDVNVLRMLGTEIIAVGVVAMSKRQVKGKELLRDFKAGVDDQILMARYGLSAQGLQSVFNKLLNAGLITQAELDARVPPAERTVDIGLFVCASCGNIQAMEFTSCPRCGFKVPEHLRKKKSETEVTTGVGEQDSPRASVKNVRPSLSSSQGVSPVSSPRPDDSTGQPKQVRTVKAAVEADTLSLLMKLGQYCRILGVASIVSCGLLLASLFALIQVSTPDGKFSVGHALLAIGGLAIPVIIISLIMFVVLRVLAESLKIFTTASGTNVKG